MMPFIKTHMYAQNSFLSDFLTHKQLPTGGFLLFFPTHDQMSRSKNWTSSGSPGFSCPWLSAVSGKLPVSILLMPVSLLLKKRHGVLQRPQGGDQRQSERGDTGDHGLYLQVEPSKQQQPNGTQSCHSNRCLVTLMS